MRKVYLAAAFGAAFLALAGVANAQGTGKSSGSTGVSTNQCWDVSNNVVRDRSGTTATGPSGDSSKTVGSTTSAGSTSAGSSGTSGASGTSANANASARPAGMPDC